MDIFTKNNQVESEFDWAEMETVLNSVHDKLIYTTYIHNVLFNWPTK